MYSTNDWRYYLAHGWGTTPEQKAKERAYNTEYYQTHKYKWYGETNSDGSVEGYFDVNPGGEYEYDEEYAQTRRKKKKGSNPRTTPTYSYYELVKKKESDPVSTYTKYVSKAYKKNRSKKNSGVKTVSVSQDTEDDGVSGIFRTSSGNHQKFVDVNPRTTPTYSYYELVKKKD